MKNMDMNEGFELIEGCVVLLGKAVSDFEGVIGRPEFIRELDRERFRYQRTNAYIFQVLKSVRVVSAYGASLCLVREGYVQEACALIRMVFEYLHDMDFVAEGVRKGKMSVKQQEMLDVFFEEDLPVVEEQLSRHIKKRRVPRKNVYAEVARGLSPDNPDRMQRIMRMLEELYSGYVHASYPHVMELYAGSVHGTWGFLMNGMPGTPRQLEGIRAVVRSIHQALNQFAKLAMQLGKPQLFNDLIEKRKTLELSAYYRKK